MPSLHIRTTPPGPRARMLLRRYERHVAPSATQSYPLVADHAAGCHVWDVDGNCYLDFTAGIAVSAIGHGHKQVVGAITAQVDRRSEDTRLNSSHGYISYAVFCLKKKKK